MLRCAVPVILLALAPVSALADASADMKTAKSQGWTVEADAEQGLVNFYKGDGSETFGFIATDGSFCQAESMTLSSEDSAMILQEVVAEYDYDFDKDDMGCTMLTFAGFGSATITSGGQDPVCGAKDNSAVRFNFE
jgi:hypothetical protein